MIKSEEKKDVVPQCPHCEKQLNKVWFRELSGLLGRRYMYFCPECKKVLGITHRKGFFMG